MLSNWIPSMTMFLMCMAIAEMGKMAVFAKMATIDMADSNFRMGIRGK